MRDERLCPAFHEPCLKEKCIAYTPMQTENYGHSWIPFKRGKLISVTTGYCSLLHISFGVLARANSDIKGETDG